MTTLGLVIRQHRWVVGFVTVVAIAITVGALVAWAALSGLSTPAHCIEDRFLDPIPAECVGTEEFLQQNEELAGKVMAAMAVLPLLAGLLLGTPLVASELESGTAMLAWSLVPSRRRWLATRLAILGLGLGALLVLPAFAADLLVAVRPPGYDMSTATLVDYGLRGPLVVARGLVAFAIGVAVGMALGRTLPALLVGGVAVLLLWNGLTMYAYSGWPPSEQFTPRPDQYYMQTGDTFVAIGVTPEDGEAAGDHGAVIGIPGERLAFVATREIVLLGGLTIVLLSASLFAVERRRPG